MIKRSGFTIVEFFVVFCIVALLAALLTPAVLEARKAANKSINSTQQEEPKRFESKIIYQSNGPTLLLIIDQETDAEYLTFSNSQNFLIRIK